MKNITRDAFSPLTSFVRVPSTARTLDIAGFPAPVETLQEVTEYPEAGKLTARNLLLSGDNPYRDRARSRVSIEASTGLLNR